MCSHRYLASNSIECSSTVTASCGILVLDPDRSHKKKRLFRWLISMNAPTSKNMARTTSSACRSADPCTHYWSSNRLRSCTHTRSARKIWLIALLALILMLLLLLLLVQLLGEQAGLRNCDHLRSIPPVTMASNFRLHLSLRLRLSLGLSLGLMLLSFTI